MLRLASTPTVINFAVRAIAAPKVRFLTISNALRESPTVYSGRHFSTDSGKLITRKVVGALESEIKSHEVAVMKRWGAPDHIPFTISDDPKYMHIMLERDFEDEKIEVTVNPIHNLPEIDDSNAKDDASGEEKNAKKSVFINVSIIKEKKGTLDLGAYVSADEIVVDRVAFTEPNTFDASLRYMVDRKGALQDSFKGFVGVRGIEEFNVGFLYNYMVEKRKHWGTVWAPGRKPETEDLKNLKKFFEEW